MLETSGRKLFRLPLQPPQNSGSPSHEGQSIPDDTATITDIDTLKNPSVVQNIPDDTATITDIDTLKNPSVVQNIPHTTTSSSDIGAHTDMPPVQNQLYDPIVDAETRKNSSLLPPPMPMPPPLQMSPPTQMQPNARKKRAPLSLRRKTLLIVLAIALLLPSLLVIFESVNGVILYRQMQGGVSHLQAAENIFHGGTSGDVSKYFDVNKLRQAQTEIDAAHADFVSLSAKLDQDGSIDVAGGLLPAQISTARALGHIAADATEAGQQFIKTTIDIAPSVAPAFQKTAANTDDTAPKPYITPASFQELNKTLDAITPLIHDMTKQAQGLSLASLPISTKQRQLLESFLPLLPVLDVGLSQEQGLRGVLGWLAGIDGQRSFLVEPMDRAELRPTGGFTGQFGTLVLNGGHMGSLKLKNIGKYEEDHTAEGSPPDPTIYPKVVGQTAPAPYTWWPIGNFGMRDANLSADFPTSAKLVMNSYKYEFGGNLDGVIMFTPNLIKQILHVTGPIVIPAYNETITEQNLEDRLHYYQLNNAGIRREQIVEHVLDNQQARKLFTQRVTSTLMTTVMHLPFNKLLPMASQMLQAMKTKDLEVYVTNPQVEALIGKYGSTVTMDRSNSHDGLFVVQANLSASKASQYVTTAMQDTVVLDSNGGATHTMQMTLDYQQKGDVYGLDTYRDYVRVYVPENSQLLTGNGFDQYDRPYCGDVQSGYRQLCQADVYGDGSLVCTPPVTIGAATSYINDPYLGKYHPLDVTGLPTNLQSDEAGRAMFGGWVVIPKNCTMKVTLSWYVPPMGQHAYSLVVQPQASVAPQMDLTVRPASGACQGKSLHYSGVMNGQDTTFAVSQPGGQCSLTS